MFKRSRRRLECDFLEERTLLSAAHAQVAAHRDAVRHKTAEVRAAGRTVAGTAVPDQATSTSGGTAGTVVGGGLISPGPAPSGNEFDLFQQVAIDDNAVMFLTQLEVLKGTTASLQQASTSVLTDARNLALLADNVANSLGVPLPTDLQGSVEATAKTAALAVNGSSFETSYLSAMSSVGSTLISQLQMLEANGLNSSLSTFAATALPIVQTDAAALASVGAGGTNTLTPVPSTPSSTTLSSADQTTLAASYVYNAEEHFLGQFTSLVSNTLQVQLYGEKLNYDHGMNLLSEGMYAAATGTYLPATITGSEATMATQVLDAATNTSGSTASYDQTYLQDMVMMHEQALSNDENTVNTTSNLVLKAFAVASLPTDLMHLNDALYLLEQMGAGGSDRASVRVADRMAHRAMKEARS